MRPRPVALLNRALARALARDGVRAAVLDEPRALARRLLIVREHGRLEALDEVTE